jgi:hypothetical protein
MFFTVSEYDDMFSENANPLSVEYEISGSDNKENISANEEMELFWEMLSREQIPCMAA